MSKLIVFFSDLGLRLVLFGMLSFCKSLNSEILMVLPFSSALSFMLVLLPPLPPPPLPGIFILLVLSPERILLISLGPLISGRGFCGLGGGAPRIDLFENAFTKLSVRFTPSFMLPLPKFKSGRFEISPSLRGGGTEFGPFVATGAGGGRWLLKLLDIGGGAAIPPPTSR